VISIAVDLPAVGALVGPLTLERIAHGGHCVGRLDGIVHFVRHGVPGEKVMVRVTDTAKRYVRSDVEAVVEASPHRIAPACPVAGECGGCDFQHVEPAFSRELKRQVVTEQLRHLAGYDWTGEVESVEPTPFGWRTRMRYSVAADHRAGLRAHRSRRVVPLPAGGCLAAVPDIRDPGPLTGETVAVAPSKGRPVFVRVEAPAVGLEEVAAGRYWGVSTAGFWQVHPQAADTLVDAVLDGLQPRPDDVAFDLYCGVGLFAGALVDLGAQVWGIENDVDAVALASTNVPEGADFLAATVDRGIAFLPEEADLVVLDPPRAGAGARVVTSVIARAPRRIAYVACDPAALGRDLGLLAEGYEVVSVRAFDLFPMTHHVECVAILERR
jgi:tRNA/tmRNA/rRNA uracil-C5-methylase (TrmA/RlmC/RlmD family)